jgi:hypothetical protein
LVILAGIFTSATLWLALAIATKYIYLSDIGIWGIFGQKNAPNDLAMLYYGHLENVNFYSD